MLRRICAALACLLWLVAARAFSTRAQAPDNQTATLREVHADGQKTLSEEQVVALTGLVLGSQVGRTDLQAAADRLVATGLFKKVSYDFQTRTGVLASYHVEEITRVPAYFDNIPWFADSELADAIRKKLPFYDGTLPEGGAAVDTASDAIKELLAARGLQVSLEHTLIGSPVGDGNVQQFHVEGSSLKIASLEFSDAALLNSKIVQQHLPEVVGKPYSRMTIDLFLIEAIRPQYLQQGHLHVKLGPPEIRLSGPPGQKLPEQIPVYVPIAAGAIYHWKGAQFSGNKAVSEFTLNALIGLKPGDLADGMKIEAGWENIEEEFGHHGFLEAKLNPVAAYDESDHSVSYAVAIQENQQYRYRKMILTGLSPTAERKLLAAWPIAAGDLFDKAKYEELLTKLQLHPAQVFGELPLHYETVGHWLQTDESAGAVDVLLDFK